ncbi:UBA domain-containing protein 7 [Mycena kentingensis (nom. inval.)]|nr:UBA domain-containing protein 7 [Mycena kentingensis (nom. inval.)]
MADAFSDLWSSAPSKPPPQKLGSPQASSNNATKPRQNDLFSMLSASSTPSGSRPITPNTRPQSKPAAPAMGGDAFSGLLGGSLNSNGGSTANMTMAQRAKLQQQQQVKAAAPVPAVTGAWAGLDSLSSFASSKPTPASAPAQTSMLDDDDWGFMSEPVNAAPTPTPAPIRKDVVDDWGFGSASPPQPETKPTAKSMGLWDHIDDFSSAPAATRATPSPPARFASPSTDFDFGDREDRADGDDFDLLGDLGKPVSRRSTPQLPVRETPPPRQSPRPQQTRSPSPPPHILGQLIEMGFTIPQSRSALAQVFNSSDGQWDVQAAIDSLLASTGGAEGSSRRPSPVPGPQHPSRRRPDDRERERPSQQPPERNGPPANTTTNDLLARTTEIGFSLFRGAERAWQQGKERVQKAYEEQFAGEDGAGGSNRPNAPSRTASGRPKWMQQNLGEEAASKQRQRDREASGSLFRDDDDDAPRRDKGGDDGWGDSRGWKDDEGATATSSRKAASPPEPEVDLFAVDSGIPAAKPVRQEAQQRPPSHRSTPPRKPSGRPAAPPVPTIPPRAHIPLSPANLQTSQTHAAAAHEKISLGQYAAASALYTHAIDALPGGHVLLVPLLTKRAEARLKEGDFRGVEEDCAGIEGIAGEGGRTLGVEPVLKVDGVDVDMGMAVLEAWKRRAEALEGRERWADAGRDWEKVAGASWGGTKDRDEGVRGAGRCRKMMEPKPAVAPPKPKPRPAPASAPASSSAPPPQAVAKYRAAVQAQEDEDTAKHALKDVVDGKLLAWKGGKETNIRALLSSLDTILWPELGLQASGMKDLVTPGQVKIRYVKAIAKLHPDKLNAGNTTLEQRMLANGVFGALNEAWNAFK